LIIKFLLNIIHTTHTLPTAETSQIHRDTTFCQNDLAVRNTADMTGGKPIAVRLQSISGASAFNPLVGFYNIHGRKGET
jgi:hypothetical protein